MRSNGSKYVVAVFALLAAYFVYTWWFNPVRAIKRQLGELAASLSVPANDTDMARVTRVAGLRRFFADDVRISFGQDGPQIASREAVLGAVAAIRPPPGGWDVQFVDVQVTLDSEAAARAHMTAEVTGRDPGTGERTVDAREARLTLAYRDGGWVITSAESPEALKRP